MEFVADFHIHSKYSRATSAQMDVENLAAWAKLKGIGLLGTGDFTHPMWLEDLKEKLVDKGDGIYAYKDTSFILTAEISCIYSKRNKTYRIHNVIFAPSFKTVDNINRYLSGIGNLYSDGRPILGLDAAELARIIFDIDPNCLIVPGHIWTPWFSLFGSASGFDRIEDCFEKQTKNIYCLETGLSSDPGMNWRLSALDRFALISNSDSHSPSKIGREANVFGCELSYGEIIDVLKKKDKKRFLYTVEFYPEEGKYHYDGHRLCQIRLSPQQAKEHKNICPKCGKPLTIGVINRVEQLADRPEGFKPNNAVPFKNLIPLDEIIADAKGLGKQSQAVEKEYMSIVQRVGTEFDILLKLPREKLYESLSERIAEGIIRVREGKVNILAGYDGEYGKIEIFGKEEEKDKQLTLF